MVAYNKATVGDDHMRRHHQQTSHVREDIDFASDVAIDPDALDVELVRLPTLYAKYSKMLADADSAVRDYEEREKVLRSELILGASENPDLLGRKIKPTAQNLEAYFRDHPNHRKMKRRLIRAQHVADLCRAAVFALQVKRASLERLTSLALGEYFAMPDVPHDLADRVSNVRADRKASARRKIKDKMKRDK